MEIEIIDGFKFEKTISYGKIVIGNLFVESNRLSETIYYINANNIKGITLNSSHGYFLKNTDFIFSIADAIERISIIDDDIILNGIESLHNLKEIIVGENRSPIDFKFFKKLEYCNISWHKNLTNLNSCKKLRHLGLWKFTYNSKNANFLIGMDQLESLQFSQSKLPDLEFLRHFRKLKILEFYYIVVLENINGLKYCAGSLNRLILNHCKRIENYDVLNELTALKWFNITDSRELENLYFLRQLKKLEHFSFTNTNVVNGDISPCIGIKHVGFNNKRNYSHTYEEIRKIAILFKKC